MAREDPHFRLRIPEDLKQKIAEVAAGNERSMTAEIVERLEKSFSSWPELDLDPEMVKKVMRMPHGAVQSLEWDIQREVRKLIQKEIADHELGRASILHSMTEAIQREPEEIRPKLMEHMERVLSRMGMGPLDRDSTEDESFWED